MNDRTPDPARYLAPGGFTRRVFNPLVAALGKAGLSLKGAEVLSVRGRRSGQWRETPVNPLDLDGHRYLVAPRGTTQWVRNLRVAGDARLRRGRRTVAVSAVELSDADKLPVLRAYLERWAWEVGTFFEVGADAGDAELAAIAPSHPVFEVRPVEPAPTA